MADNTNNIITVLADKKLIKKKSPLRVILKLTDSSLENDMQKQHSFTL